MACAASQGVVVCGRRCAGRGCALVRKLANNLSRHRPRKLLGFRKHQRQRTCMGSTPSVTSSTTFDTENYQLTDYLKHYVRDRSKSNRKQMHVQIHSTFITNRKHSQNFRCNSALIRAVSLLKCDVLKVVGPGGVMPSQKLFLISFV